MSPRSTARGSGPPPVAQEQRYVALGEGLDGAKHHRCCASAERLFPATIGADRVALVGMHDWTDPTLPAIADAWGLTVFDPNAPRSDSAPLVDWLRRIGATKVAIHFDVASMINVTGARELQHDLPPQRQGSFRPNGSI